MFTAKSIADAISKDFTKDQIDAMTEEFKIEVTLAYIEADYRKVKQFQDKYMTNEEFKDGFNLMIYTQLRGE